MVEGEDSFDEILNNIYNIERVELDKELFGKHQKI